ncbi:N-acetylmuramoyl-L-alanine amidase [uncultured Adlercreutzia sp.]|uniref:N-acetylmuramoyl-L-alanine amidase n=1 Tax=uncultured Adlercreutzia sp. TaxID=875803 RepID=UPI0026F3AA9F|nr:peptidoglycan recognition family protein [uncultured Adlercreutzia sp.]
MSLDRPISINAIAAAALALAVCPFALCGCSAPEAGTIEPETVEPERAQIEVEPIRDVPQTPTTAEEPTAEPGTDSVSSEEKLEANSSPETDASELRASPNLHEDYRDSFDHGPKGTANQKYIVLHDTEGDSDAASVIDWWDSNGNLVAAHFIVNKDGSIWQCVPLDRIAHHAGYGDTGHNDTYGIEEDGRDDMAGSSPIGSSYADYGMNAWSVGIEMVHVGGEGDYPEAQLEAVDSLIAYIDVYFGFESEIIDHKAWRTGNSDTSPEFADYLKSYQTTRKHK